LLIGEDIFPFLNFSNHSQHGVDVEKYMPSKGEAGDIGKDDIGFGSDTKEGEEKDGV
jgi:hypothetical protein